MVVPISRQHKLLEATYFCDKVAVVKSRVATDNLHLSRLHIYSQDIAQNITVNSSPQTPSEQLPFYVDAC